MAMVPLTFKEEDYRTEVYPHGDAIVIVVVDGHLIVFYCQHLKNKWRYYTMFHT